jgi:hypothetical protein
MERQTIFAIKCNSGHATPETPVRKDTCHSCYALNKRPTTHRTELSNMLCDAFAFKPLYSISAGTNLVVSHIPL